MVKKNQINQSSSFHLCLKINTKNNDTISWLNDRLSSIRYCRPIKFEFVKELRLKTLQEYHFYGGNPQIGSNSREK